MITLPIPDLIVFSHLRWRSAYQRPRHPLRRISAAQRVFFFEEPVPATVPRFDARQVSPSLWVVVPFLPAGMAPPGVVPEMRGLFERLFAQYSIGEYVVWISNPVCVVWTSGLSPRQVVYDYMDELALCDRACAPSGASRLPLRASAGALCAEGNGLRSRAERGLNGIANTSHRDGRTREARHAFFETNGNARDEAMGRTQGGRVRSTPDSAQQVDVGGEPCLVRFQDTTELKRAGEKLARTRQRLTATLESITDAYLSVDHDWNLTYVNRQGESILRRKREELLGTNIWDAFPDAVDTDFYVRSHECARTGKPVRYEAWYAPFARWYEVNTYPTPEGLDSYFRDVTERRVADDVLREREATLGAIFNGTSDAILIADDRARYIDVNPAACALYGVPRETLLGRSVRDYSVTDYRPIPEDEWKRLLLDGGQTGIFDLRRPDGEMRKIEYRLQAHFMRGRHMVVLRDISARVQAESALRASEEYMRALVERSADMITVLDAGGMVRYSSPAQQRLMGYTEEAIGEHMFAHVHPDDVPRLRTLMEHVHAASDRVVTSEVRVRDAYGAWHVLEATATNLLANPSVQGIVINSRDITERKLAEAQLIHNAFHDALTGLPNRALFVDRLEQALSRLTRLHHNGCSAVLLLDLDGFKTVNDSLGHAAGDQLLVQVATRLAQYIRPGDTVARFGGDEFAILLEEISDDHEVFVLAEQIAAAMNVYFEVDGREVVNTVSIGIAICRHGDAPAEVVLRDAGIALHSVKRNGQSRYAVADPALHDAIMARREMERDLRRALEREELVLRYQPIFSIDGRRIHGVEALIHWLHPVRGSVSPAEFIPLAEESGLIGPIGEWVMRRACSQIQACIAAGMPRLYVSVNLSAQQFEQPAFVAMVERVLAETGLEPALLGLELTESMLMGDGEATVAALQQFRAIGIEHLAIDDFGTGYSSLSYLQRFPVTEVKIDRSFIQDVATAQTNTVIATAIINLAHGLSLRVIAEGIETEAQRAFLERAGCDYFQGYLGGQPMSAAALERFVSERGR